MAAVTIIGIGDNGCVGMSAKAYNCIQKAQVLVGGERHLDFFSDFKGEKMTLKNGLMNAIYSIGEKCQEENVVVLASGDPLFYGVGDIITKKVGKEHVEIIPTCSSVQLAFSRIGKKWDDAKVISLHGRGIKGLVNKIRDEYKVFLMTDEVNTPSAISEYLQSYDETDWSFTVCENLEGSNEKIHQFANIADVKGDFSPLNVVILLRDPKKISKRSITARVEDAFQKRMPKKGLITKKEVRAIALMNMELCEDSTVWDIGAGSGSISMESALIAKNGHVYAVETDPLGVEICEENKRSFKVDNVTVVHTSAPEGLSDLPKPDRIFIGGTKGKMEEIISVCYEALKGEGVLVLSAITMQSVALALDVFEKIKLKPEVQLVQVSRGKPLAHYLRYEALNPIHLFTVKKEGK
ncbi:precorrin-6y C5,15-methyltransferase (decarboxylating) subunit CbiE [Bacteriovoracales bacterium]|nr:precorrin-6y C5,15-methyltransferase (decarboxylating) subunit CbiE [Bacteriovoracales bacterium]